MFIPYSLTKTDIGYGFTSDFEINYHLYFSKYYLVDENGEDVVVTSFSFFNEQDVTKIRDPRVKATIISFITDFFDKNPELGVLYVCDPRDNLARHRRIIFGSWYREMEQHIEKFDCKGYHADLGYYSSLLIRADNPKKQHFVDAFYRHLEDLLSEDEALSDNILEDSVAN